MQQALFKELAIALVRWLLTAGGTALVGHQIITAEQLPRFVEGFTGPLVGAGLMALALAWSFGSKYWAHIRLAAARELPAGASDEQLRDRMRDLFFRGEA